MDAGKMNIVFMGTPAFAIPSLDILLKNGYNIVAVITAPDKPAGRGRKLAASPVKKYAIDHGLRIMQPEKLKDERFVKKLKALNPDLAVVVAFRMLPPLVWQMPAKGTFNLHASLLPQYRGAAPINHAIINGEKETGITTFFIDEKIDTGSIIFQEKVDIAPDETAGDLHDKLMIAGAELVLKTVQAIQNDEVIPLEQDEAGGNQLELKQAPKIQKEDCRINWYEPVIDIYNLIRGMSPYPAAYTYLTTGEETRLQMKIYRAECQHENKGEQPGTLVTDYKKYLKIAAPDGYINLKEIQLEGRRRVEVTQFLPGMKDITNYHAT
ncbi:MAG: methionyl-tRNA formyltransferase [Bacteroidota bacterium]